MDTRDKNSTFKTFHYLFAPPLPPPPTLRFPLLSFPILPESNRQENKTNADQ